MKYIAFTLIMLVATLCANDRPALKVGESTPAPIDGFADFEGLNHWASTSSFGGGGAGRLQIGGTNVFYSNRMFTSGLATSELNFFTQSHDGRIRSFLLVPTQLKEHKITTENDQIVVRCYNPSTKEWPIAMIISSWMLPDPKEREQAGSGQPATSPESKSEGGDNPQPEAEGLSR